jgi:hypothetical protein
MDGPGEHYAKLVNRKSSIEVKVYHNLTKIRNLCCSHGGRGRSHSPVQCNGDNKFGVFYGMEL